MAHARTDDLSTRFEELSSSAQLDILVPTSADFDPTSLFHDGLPGRLSSAPSRRNLYFDETTQLNVILRTSLGERAVRNLLAGAEIVLGAHATDAVPQGKGNAASASGKHDLTSKTISGMDLTNVLYAGGQTYIIWKPTLHISRPKSRLQRPAVYFTATLSLTPTALTASRIGRRDILHSFEPLPANVLEPLQFDSALGESSGYLPVDRVTKVLPASAHGRDQIKPIRGATKRAVPIVPALYSRVRYSKLPDATIASLHLEASHLVRGSVEIDQIELNVGGVDVHAIDRSAGERELRPGDEVVHLYRLVPAGQVAATTNAPVSVRITASVHTDQIAVSLDITSQSQFDLDKTASRPAYKWSRPLSSGTAQRLPRPSTQSAARPSSSDLQRAPPTGWRGAAFTFTAQTSINAGEEFRISVHCANRSDRARRFAIVVLHAKRPTSSSRLEQGSAFMDKESLASIFDPPSKAQAKPPDILDLNPDVRIGPLPAGAVFETQLKFRALVDGPLHIGVIRIVDLDTRQTVDVRELPDVIAVKWAKDGAAFLHA